MYKGISCIKNKLVCRQIELINIQGGPQKCPYFSLAITFTKIRKPSRFFHPQILEGYRILLVETTLESIML